jgi:nucleotide-binding universal stress UspA family protein
MFTKVLVPLDRSALAEQALGRAGALARACRAGVDIVLVHQPENYTAFGDDLRLEERQLVSEKQFVGGIADLLASDGSLSVTHAVVKGDVVTSIVSRAHEISADLIVMTSHGRTGLSRAWLGSVADGVIRRAAIPVLMLRPVEGRTSALAPSEPFRTILVPLDGSPEALRVLDAARTFARCDKARLMLLRVVQPVPLVTGDASSALVYPALIPDDVATAGLVDEAMQQLAGTARRLQEEGSVKVAHEVRVASSVAQAILDFARACGADMIAMSTHGRGASRLLIGSVADKVVRGSGVPVLLRGPAVVSGGAPTRDAPRAE